jgi:hypothetical protein
VEHLQKLIGKRVVKFPSNKPFKSGLKTNTVKGIITHKETGLPAFLFKEDDSYVKVQKCIPENFKIDFKEVYRLYPGCSIVRVMEFYIPGTGWKKEWSNNVKIQNDRNGVEHQIKRCWIEGGMKVMLHIEHEGEIKEPDYSINELVTF